MTIDKDIGRKIKYLRKKKNITQTDLGRAVFNKSESACQNTIKNIETGRRSAKADELATILKELNITDTEFNDLNLSAEPGPLPLSQHPTKKHRFFPEIDYYSRLYEEAADAGDHYMILQIYKAMAKKIDDTIHTLEETLQNAGDIKKTNAPLDY